MAKETWSGTIDPQSGCRLPPPRRQDLSDEGRQVMDRQLDPANQSLVGLRGPTGIRLHSPTIAHHCQGLVAHYRNHSVLDKQVQEIAILTTARAHDSNFEWAAHEPAARRVGVSDATITAIRDDLPTGDLGPRDELIISIGRQLFAEHRLSEALYAEAVSEFGHQGIVELISLMGMYAGTAYLLAAFDMQLPDGTTPALQPARDNVLE